jgi:hypothetical protein
VSRADSIRQIASTVGCTDVCPDDNVGAKICLIPNGPVASPVKPPRSRPSPLAHLVRFRI